jgi:hypothetical protein
MEQLELKSIEKHSFKDNLNCAETLPPVKDGSLSKEQAAYCLAWKDIVNPESKKGETIMYNAMGPDFLTAFLVSNAEKIYGIDSNPPTYEKLVECFENWDNIDNDSNSIPPINDNCASVDKKIHPKSLQKIIKLRAEQGFWDTEEMSAWPIEHCIIIEMKKMGIDKSTVKIENINERAQISFDWAYPEEETRRRTVVYIAQKTDDIINDPNHCGITSIDGYYEKSMNSPRFNFLDTSSSDLPYIAQLINLDGFALIGRTQFSLFDMENEEKRLEQVTRDQFGPAFNAIDIDSEYKTMMKETFVDKDYNWSLYGMIKNEQ